MTKRIPALAAAALMATVVGSNLALETFGVIPVGFGLSAPAGVYLAGVAFGLRDLLHEAAGPRWVLAAIAAGAALSYLVSDGATIPGGLVSIAVASAAAFLVSELADFAVYSPLRRRHWTAAAVASNLVGAVVDSVVFLMLAFGTTDLLAGQVVGKVWATIAVVPLVALARRSAGAERTCPRCGLDPVLAGDVVCIMCADDLEEKAADAAWG